MASLFKGLALVLVFVLCTRFDQELSALGVVHAEESCFSDNSILISVSDETHRARLILLDKVFRKIRIPQVTGNDLVGVLFAASQNNENFRIVSNPPWREHYFFPISANEPSTQLCYRGIGGSDIHYGDVGRITFILETYADNESDNYPWSMSGNEIAVRNVPLSFRRTHEGESEECNEDCRKRRDKGAVGVQRVSFEANKPLKRAPHDAAADVLKLLIFTGCLVLIAAWVVRKRL